MTTDQRYIDFINKTEAHLLSVEKVISCNSSITRHDEAMKRRALKTLITSERMIGINKNNPVIRKHQNWLAR